MKNSEYKPITQEGNSSLLEKLKTKFGKDFLIAIASTMAFLPLSAQKSDTQNKTKLLTQNETKLDSSVQKEFEKQKKFMINWFSNRILIDDDLQTEFEKIKPKILENYKKVVLKEDTIPYFNHLNMKGIAMNRNDTVFLNLKVPSKKGQEHHTTIVHELGHQALPIKNDKSEMPEWMVNLIKKALVPTEKLIIRNPDSNLVKEIAYLQEPGEVYARIFVLREKYNLQPNKVVKVEELEKIYIECSTKVVTEGTTSRDINDLLGIIRMDSIVDLLNKLP